MVVKIVLIFCLAFIFVSPSEFWLEPQKFKFQVGEEMKIDITEGENLTGERWDVRARHLEKAQVLSASATVDLLPVIGKSGGKNFMFKIVNEGTHLVVVSSNAFREEFSSEEGKVYLEENGLEDVVKEVDRPLKLTTTLYSKLLVQAGASMDDVYGKKGGTRLELVPGKNPYSLKVSDHIPFILLLEGKPLPHALIKVWTRVNRTTFLQNMYTENDGTIKFPLGFSGVWMVSAVRLVPSKKTMGEWDNLKASLIFGM